MKAIATKTRRHEDNFVPWCLGGYYHLELTSVRYRTSVDRFRTKNSKESFRHLVFASYSCEHLSHLMRVPGKKCGVGSKNGNNIASKKVV